MEMTPIERRQAREGLRTRIAGNTWATLDDGVAALYALSEDGFTREELYFIVGELAGSPPPGADESTVDLVWDLGSHLIGQCNPHQLIRLHGDPIEADALADHVLSQPWRLAKPPDGDTEE
jgi:hypothetical protein